MIYVYRLGLFQVGVVRERSFSRVAHPAKAGLSDRETRNALDVGGLGGRRPWGISSESLLGQRGLGPAASRGRETRHRSLTSNGGQRQCALHDDDGCGVWRVSTSMRCGLRSSGRACLSGACRPSGRCNTYLLTYLDGNVKHRTYLKHNSLLINNCPQTI